MMKYSKFMLIMFAACFAEAMADDQASKRSGVSLEESATCFAEAMADDQAPKTQGLLSEESATCFAEAMVEDQAPKTQGLSCEKIAVINNFLDLLKARFLGLSDKELEGRFSNNISTNISKKDIFDILEGLRVGEEQFDLPKGTDCKLLLSFIAVSAVSSSPFFEEKKETSDCRNSLLGITQSYSKKDEIDNDELAEDLAKHIDRCGRIYIDSGVNAGRKARSDMIKKDKKSKQEFENSCDHGQL